MNGRKIKALRFRKKLTLHCVNPKIHTMNLEYIDCSGQWPISRGHLKTLKAFEKYPNLKRLNCSFNAIESLDGLFKCSKLKMLNVSRNNISLEQIKLLKCLKELLCIGCGLYQLPICLNNLTTIDCSDNSITSLECLSEFKELKFLNCSKNKLNRLCIPRRLEYLICNHNQIEELELEEDCKLKILHIAYNDTLFEIPDKLGNLNLSLLDITCCCLYELPKALSKLDKNLFFYAYGNFFPSNYPTTWKKLRKFFNGSYVTFNVCI